MQKRCFPVCTDSPWQTKEKSCYPYRLAVFGTVFSPRLLFVRHLFAPLIPIASSLAYVGVGLGGGGGTAALNQGWEQLLTLQGGGQKKICQGGDRGENKNKIFLKLSFTGKY